MEEKVDKSSTKNGSPRDAHAEDLRASFEEAVTVHAVMLDLYVNLDTERQEALSGALVAFGADVATLQYYVELSEREPLLEEDQQSVFELTDRIDEAIEMFVSMVDLL